MEISLIHPSQSRVLQRNDKLRCDQSGSLAGSDNNMPCSRAEVERESWEGGGRAKADLEIATYFICISQQPHKAPHTTLRN